MANTVKIHSTADVSTKARIGAGTSIWNWAQIREDVSIGEQCILSKGVYIDVGVTIGNRVKIQNNVSVFHGVSIEDGVFVGPHVCFTNDMTPRAISPDKSLKGSTDWIVTETWVRMGASIGANSTIRCGVEIGEWAMVGAGSVVLESVPRYALVVGNPARLIGYVCRCGARLPSSPSQGVRCKACGTTFESDSLTEEKSS